MRCNGYYRNQLMPHATTHPSPSPKNMQTLSSSSSLLTFWMVYSYMYFRNLALYTFLEKIMEFSFTPVSPASSTSGDLSFLESWGCWWCCPHPSCSAGQWQDTPLDEDGSHCPMWAFRRLVLYSRYLSSDLRLSCISPVIKKTFHVLSIMGFKPGTLCF